jgi:Late competence development protein ComFB
MTAFTRNLSTYRNAIEPLVVQELEQQLLCLPSQAAKYINPAQVIAYALNRLPALYATSEEGWRRQQMRAREKLKCQIATAVRQGIVAVQQDPLKVSTPLRLRGELEDNAPAVHTQETQSRTTRLPNAPNPMRHRQVRL